MEMSLETTQSNLNQADELLDMLFDNQNGVLSDQMDDIIKPGLEHDDLPALSFPDFHSDDFLNFGKELDDLPSWMLDDSQDFAIQTPDTIKTPGTSILKPTFLQTPVTVITSHTAHINSDHIYCASAEKDSSNTNNMVVWDGPVSPPLSDISYSRSVDMGYGTEDDILSVGGQSPHSGGQSPHSSTSSVTSSPKAHAISPLPTEVESLSFADIDFSTLDAAAFLDNPVFMQSLQSITGDTDDVSLDLDLEEEEYETDDVKSKRIKLSQPQSNKKFKTETLPFTMQDTIDTTDYTQYTAELRLSDEEKVLLSREGISIPTNMPLTKEEERLLKSVRRKIRNKVSAKESRKRKTDYIEGLEKRVKMCSQQNANLHKKVQNLEKQNVSLMGQMKKLQQLLSMSGTKTAQASTCVMVLMLSFALLIVPNLNPFLNDLTTATSKQVQQLMPPGNARTLKEVNELKMEPLAMPDDAEQKDSLTLVDIPEYEEAMEEEVVTVTTPRTSEPAKAADLAPPPPLHQKVPAPGESLLKKPLVALPTEARVLTVRSELPMETDAIPIETNVHPTETIAQPQEADVPPPEDAGVKSNRTVETQTEDLFADALSDDEEGGEGGEYVGLPGSNDLLHSKGSTLQDHNYARPAGMRYDPHDQAGTDLDSAYDSDSSSRFSPTHSPNDL